MAPAPHLDPDALQTLHQAIAARVERAEFPGAVTLVARVSGETGSATGSETERETDREQLDVAVFGETGLASGDPMRRDTPFRLTSMTKPIVAATVVALVDAGAFALDDPVDRFLPELADRRVLKHLDGPLDQTVPADRPITLRDLLSVPEDQARRLPAWYATDGATGALTRPPADPWQTWAKPAIFPAGAAGLISTIDDYYAFARMLLRHGTHEGRRVLSPESVAQMTTNQLTPAQVAEAPFPLDGAGWGMGVSVTPDGRYGWDGGWGTAWSNHPHLGLCTIFLSQTTDVIFNGTTTEFDTLAAQAATVTTA